MLLKLKHILLYKQIICWIIVFLLPSWKSFSQISFDKFPENLQLFPRNLSTNAATVSIVGTVTEGNYEKVTLTVLKNNTIYQTQERTIEYSNNSFPFTFDVNINAELSEYSFQVSLTKNGTANVVKQADRVVCGDVILVYGQSNALGIPGVDDLNANASDQFLRNYDFPDFTTNDPSSLKWYSGKFPYARVGTMSFQLGRLIVDNYHVPVCVINGAEGGKSITELSFRTANNHLDQNTLYGKWLLRITKAGVLNNIRAMIFRQGENEAGSYYLLCNEYPANFAVFYNEMLEDLPQLQKIYFCQNNILNGPYVERAGFMRDFQRQSKQIYPKIETLATVGTTAYEAPHYNGAGYLQTGNELFRLVARDFYGSTDVNQINSPDIKNAYFNDTKDILTLVFDDNQQMIYPQDIDFGDHIRSMKDFIFINSDNQTVEFNENEHPVASGWAEGNKIMLKLKAPSSGTYVTYLPSTFSDNYSADYDGVHLENARGMRAFSFYEIPISGTTFNPTSTPTVVTTPIVIQQPTMPTTTTSTTTVTAVPPVVLLAPSDLVAATATISQINLTWKDNADNETYFVLERSVDKANYFAIDSPTANATSDISKELYPNLMYYYRIKACNTAGCSAYSNVAKAITTIIAEPVAPQKPAAITSPTVSATLICPPQICVPFTFVKLAK